MTLHYKDWDDTAHQGDGDTDAMWYTVRDLANRLCELVAELKTLNVDVAASSSLKWLPAEIEDLLADIMDVAKTMWRDKTEDRLGEPADPFSDDLIPDPVDPAHSAWLKELATRRQSGETLEALVKRIPRPTKNQELSQ